MVVSCQSCGQEFDLGSDPIPPEGVQFDCSNCGAQVVVQPEGAEAAPEPAAPAAAPEPEPAAPSAPEPAPASSGSIDDDDDIDMPMSGGKKGLIVLAILVIAGVGYGVFNYLSSQIPEEATKTFFDTRSIYYTDTLEAFPKAEAGFQKADEMAGGNYTDAKAMLAQVYLTWGEYLKIQANDNRKKHDAIAAKMNKGEKVDEAAMKAFGKKFEDLQRDGTNLQNKGELLLKKFAGKITQNYTVLLSVSDYYRIQGDVGKFEKTIGAAEQLNPNTGILAFVKGMQKSDEDAKEPQLKEAVTHFQKAIELKPDMLKSRVKLAQAQARLGQKDAAVKTLDELLGKSPKHEIALLLKAEWTAPPTPPPAPSASPEAKKEAPKKKKKKKRRRKKR